MGMGSDTSDSTWRPLLPRLDRPDQPTNSLSAAALPPLRATPVAVACENCRKRKVKCDGARPACNPCRRKKLDCVYPVNAEDTKNAALKRKYEHVDRDVRQLQAAHETLLHFVSALQTRSDADAASLLQRLRHGHNIDTISRQLQAGDLLLQLHVKPDTRLRHEFPFQANMPEVLLRSNNAYLHSLLYETSISQDAALPSTPSLDLHIDKHKPQYHNPFGTAYIIDSRLDMVDLTKWTSVTTDNHLLKTLLRLYLLHEYHWSPCFQKDYFLDDMLSGSEEFCSSLLVNAVLAQACACMPDLSDRLEYWNPQSLVYKFFAEAKRLWELEQMEEACITTIQAALIMNMVYDMHSLDKIGMTYGAQAVSMAAEIDLFKRQPQTLSKRKQDGRAFTAWCLYFWVTSQCYHFMLPPLIKSAPETLLPDPITDAVWYGEFSLQYPLNSSLHPMHHPEIFKAKNELCMILHPLSVELFTRRGDFDTELRRAHLIHGVSRLKNWYTLLPHALTPSQIVLPPQLQVHLWYHNLMMNMCELLIPSSDIVHCIQPADFATSTLAHSKICFETILRLYYMRHGFEAASAFMTHGLTVFAFMALGSLKGETAPLTDNSSSTEAELRSSLILAVKGLSEQARSYYTPFTIFHVIQKAMSARDVSLLRGTMGSSWYENIAFGHVRTRLVKSRYPLNTVKVTDHPESQRLENMIKTCDILNMEDAGPFSKDSNSTSS